MSDVMVDPVLVPRLVMSLEETSEVLSMSTETVRKLAMRRLFPLPSIQPMGKGGRILFPVDAVRQWVDDETSDPFRARGAAS